MGAQTQVSEEVEEEECESKITKSKTEHRKGRGWEQEGYTNTCRQVKCWEVREGSTCRYVQW